MTAPFCALGINIVSNKTKCPREAYVLEIWNKVKAGAINLKTVMHRWHENLRTENQEKGGNLGAHQDL